MLLVISVLGLFGTLVIAWKLDKAFALKLLAVLVVGLVVVGIALAGVEEPIRSWMVPVI